MPRTADSNPDRFIQNTRNQLGTMPWRNLQGDEMTVAQEEYCRSHREYQRLREELHKSLMKLEEISTDQKLRHELIGSLPIEKLLLLQDRTADEALELMRLKNLYFLCSTYEAEGTRRWAALKPEERMGLPGPPA